MIDTVILTIPKEGYKILDPSRFKPSAKLLDVERLYLAKCMNNPTLEDKQGFYKPRMTAMRRPSKTTADIPLRIEFSVPKLLYQHNVDEVQESDFDEVVKTLRVRMKQMGVDTTEEAIKSAQVSALHVSKNILLKDYTASHVLSELSKVNYNRKLDLEKTKFRNNGHALNFYSKSNSFVLYDKIKDIQQHNGRTIDNDQTNEQLALFADPNDLEILRLEVRLSNRTKLKTLLSVLGYKQNPTFEYVFKKDLCQKVMSSYWQTIASDKHRFLFDHDKKPQKILQELITKLDVGPKQTIYLVGLKILCKDSNGISGLRLCLQKNCSQKTWQRITQDFDLLNAMSSDKDRQEWLGQINDEIEQFPAFKMANCRVKNSKVY